MDDTLFYADVDLPFHVWVREPGSNGTFAWVLREAPQAHLRAAALSARSDRARPTPTRD